MVANLTDPTILHAELHNVQVRLTITQVPQKGAVLACTQQDLHQIPKIDQHQVSAWILHKHLQVYAYQF